jgi:hypothetical protein
MALGSPDREIGFNQVEDPQSLSRRQLSRYANQDSNGSRIPCITSWRAVGVAKSLPPTVKVEFW